MSNLRLNHLDQRPLVPCQAGMPRRRPRSLHSLNLNVLVKDNPDLSLKHFLRKPNNLVLHRVVLNSIRVFRDWEISLSSDSNNRCRRLNHTSTHREWEHSTNSDSNNRCRRLSPRLSRPSGFLQGLSPKRNGKLT